VIAAAEVTRSPTAALAAATAASRTPAEDILMTLVCAAVTRD
jgi:hypothetical protein